MCFNFPEMCADACVAAGYDGACDREECVAVDVVPISGGAVKVSLYETEGARTVS